MRINSVKWSGSFTFIVFKKSGRTYETAPNVNDAPAINLDHLVGSQAFKISSR